MIENDRMTNRKNIMTPKAEEIAVVVAVNDDAVLNGSLMRSPEARTREVVLRRGYASAGQAYNSGMATCASDIVVFAHQDVYLPEGWFEAVARAIAAVSARDPHWGVLGIYGISLAGTEAGYLYSTGLQRVVGCPFDEPVEVGSLDEVVLIVRRSSGLQFDAELPGFHLYGTDICLQARRQGLKCYAIPAFCIHNSNGFALLSLSYLKSMSSLRRKWRNHLPINTPCMKITRWGMPLLQHYSSGSIRFMFNHDKVGRRCADPEALYRQLLKENKIGPLPRRIGGKTEAERLDCKNPQGQPEAGNTLK